VIKQELSGMESPSAAEAIETLVNSFGSLNNFVTSMKATGIENDVYPSISLFHK
jgi:hypothetical protein